MATPAPSILAKDEQIAEVRKAHRASKAKPPPPLSSRSGSAAAMYADLKPLVAFHDEIQSGFSSSSAAIMPLFYHYLTNKEAVYYTVIKHDGLLRTRGKCRKHEPHYYIDFTRAKQ